MLRVLLPILAVLVIRALWRLIVSVLEGMRGGHGPGAPPSSVRMVRDPVCGTFVLPERAIVVSNGRHQLFFCSSNCRDQYRARTA